MTDPSPLRGLVAGRLQRIEIAMLARVLAGTLAGALPPSQVRVERRRSPVDVLKHRPGTVVGVTVVADNRVLRLRVLDVDRVEASVAHEVRGVTLSRQDVPVSRWLDELAGVLEHEANTSEQTRQALQRALLS